MRLTRRQRGLGLWAFQRRLTGEGGPAADLERRVSGQRREGRGRGPLVPTWASRTVLQKQTRVLRAQSSVPANLKIPVPDLFFFTPSWSPNFSSYPPSYSLLSLTILSGSPWTHLLILPSESPVCWVGQNRAGLPAVQVQVGSSSKGPPTSLNSLLSNAN